MDISTFWTETDRKDAASRSVLVMYSNTTKETIKEEEKTLPSDIHLVEYEINGNLYLDAVRAFKQVDIFDVYYDRLWVYKQDGYDCKIVSITSGHGVIKPKLYNPPKGE